jgi:uncharacterized protein (DUF3084 family)
MQKYLSSDEGARPELKSPRIVSLVNKTLLTSSLLGLLSLNIGVLTSDAINTNMFDTLKQMLGYMLGEKMANQLLQRSPSIVRKTDVARRTNQLEAEKFELTRASSRLEKEKTKLLTDNEALDHQNKKIGAEHDELKARHKDLNSEHDGLKSRHQKLTESPRFPWRLVGLSQAKTAA